MYLHIEAEYTAKNMHAVTPALQWDVDLIFLLHKSESSLFNRGFHKAL